MKFRRWSLAYVLAVLLLIALSVSIGWLFAAQVTTRDDLDAAVENLASSQALNDRLVQDVDGLRAQLLDEGITPEAPPAGVTVEAIQGERGEPGETGLAGRDGRDGTDGVDGAPGAAGPQGPVGPQGPAGRDGVDGTDGTDGQDGQDGAPGPQGPPGADSTVPGPQGPAGPGVVVGAECFPGYVWQERQQLGDDTIICAKAEP